MQKKIVIKKTPASAVGTKKPAVVKIPNSELILGMLKEQQAEQIDETFFDQVFTKYSPLDFRQAIEKVVDGSESIDLLKKVSEVFNLQYARVAQIGPPAQVKELLKSQTANIEKSFREAKPCIFFANIIKKKELIHPQIVWIIADRLAQLSIDKS